MIVKKLTISRLLNDVQQCTPQWGVQATERSCVSKMEGLRPDKFAFAKRSEAMKAPVGLSNDRTVLRQQDGGVSLRQVPVFETEKSQFKEAKYNEKSYYYDDCGICFSCLAVQRCVAALVWHHWRWSPRILYLSDLWWNYSSFRYYSRLY